MSIWSRRSVATTLAELNEEWKDCKSCPFYVQRSSVVMGVGNPGSVVFAVGQYPGVEEDKQGVPFIGPGGQVTKQQFLSLIHI